MEKMCFFFQRGNRNGANHRKYRYSFNVQCSFLTDDSKLLNESHFNTHSHEAREQYTSGIPEKLKQLASLTNTQRLLSNSSNVSFLENWIESIEPTGIAIIRHIIVCNESWHSHYYYFLLIFLSFSLRLKQLMVFPALPFSFSLPLKHSHCLGAAKERCEPIYGGDKSAEKGAGGE